MYNTEGETTMGIVRISVAVDKIAPTVSLGSPGGTVSGNVPLVATARDNVSVAGVKFFDGAAQIGRGDHVSPYSAIWNGPAVADGSHTLTAVARDAAGNSATSNTVVVTVNNAPPPPPPRRLTLAATASVDGAGPITTAAMSIASPGALLVALAASDGPPAGTNTQSLTISGGGLTWTRLQRAVAMRGDAEIWDATAPAAMSLTVRSVQANATINGLPVNQSLRSSAFTGWRRRRLGEGQRRERRPRQPRDAVGRLGRSTASASTSTRRLRARPRPARADPRVPRAERRHDVDQGLNAPTGAAGGTATLNDTAPTADQ